MNVLVVGSINMDFVMDVKEIVKPGETTSSNNYEMFYGGKGSNQAVNCANLGADVSFIGSLGEDDYGRRIMNHFNKVGIQTEGVSVRSQTGIAVIQIDSNGENAIVLVPGANYSLTEEDVKMNDYLFRECDIVLLQLEIPIQVVEKAVDLACNYGKKIILNPAPVKKLSSNLLNKIDILTPNKIELEELTGIKVNSLEDIVKAGRLLINKGVNKIITTLGSKGSVLITKESYHAVPSEKCSVVDTTGAGDAYNAGLAVGLVHGLSEISAMELATRVSAFVVGERGAQPKVPSIKYFLST
ncbi:ribokinase [Salirhabdus euzebyi]|uniref:Ribokinase n=1 Tax=Salirhabdus euzebyi TaxID=394506 RepID=A0A841Q8D8_9BACI|nr:ribokinase [Salirhabdus euzebyi]MBB6454584.1 ribokinase [Salirhabdus euzebyi]